VGVCAFDIDPNMGVVDVCVDDPNDDVGAVDVCVDGPKDAGGVGATEPELRLNKGFDDAD
jgi:hypothetical protein